MTVCVACRLDTEYKLLQAAMVTRALDLQRRLDSTIQGDKLIYDEGLPPIPKDVADLMDVVASQRRMLQALTEEIQTLQAGHQPLQ